MEEKFSVSLELMIQKFKDGAKKAQDVSKNVASKIKENMSVDVGTNAFKGMTAESELLLNKINDIKATLQMAKSDNKLFSNTEVLEMRVELEKLEKQYNKINQSSNMFGSSFNKIQDGMNKSLKSAKRFTLSLFGIHSIYRMLSRASSAYLAQDQETSNKIQAAWIGLGSVFAPLLQTIANFAIKAVSYINVFIKALTGTDFLANAMAKSMNKANKSAGRLSKTLAGFDELTNLDDSTAGASVDTSWVDSFKNVELDQKVVKYLKNIAGWLKENKELILAIVGIFAGSIIIAKLAGIFSWLFSIKGLGMALIFIGIATAIEGIIKYIKDPSWNNFLTIIGGLAIVVAGIALIFGGWVVAIGALVAAIVVFIAKLGLQQTETEKAKKATKDLQKAEEDLKVAKDNLRRSTDEYIYAVDRAEASARTLLETEKKLNISGAELQKQVDDGTLSYEAMNEKQREVYRAYRDNINAQDELKNSKIKLTEETKKEQKASEELAEKYKIEADRLATKNSKIKEISDEYKKNQTAIENLKKKIKDLTGQDYSAKIAVTTDTSKAKNGLSSFFRNMGSTLLNLVLPGFSLYSILGKISSLDIGTNYVPNDQLAQIHKGEAVIPKKFNSDEYVKRSDYNNNSKLESLLEELIDRVEQIEINPYTTIKDVGTASVGYINNQNRIMGRGVI